MRQMRWATLYQVTESRMAIDRDYITLRQMTGRPMDSIFMVGTDFATLASEDIRVPIDHVVDVTTYGREESWIAIDPKLRALLEVPLSKELNELRETLGHRDNSIASYEKLVRDFANLPWYKRAWRAINNDCFK